MFSCINVVGSKGYVSFLILNEKVFLFFFGKSDLFLGVVSLMVLQIQAQDILVGNIIWLRENDEVPCDLVLIGTSDPQGVCYVEVIKS
jgi:hypothetical protein